MQAPTPPMVATKRRRHGRRLAAAVAVATLALSACSSDSDDAADLTTAPAETTAPTDTTAPAETTAPTDTTAPAETTAPTDGAGAGDMMGASGPACDAVPADGEGSFAGMADDSAATAASNNPLLSTLVEAVVAADLVDTLNSDGPFTVFAPTDDAFAAVPADQLSAVLADQDLLTSVLTYHVIAGEQLSGGELVAAGSATTVNGAELTFAAAGDTFEVNGTATTICQDVPTANAVVHIVDAVLLPG